MEKLQLYTGLVCGIFILYIIINTTLMIVSYNIETTESLVYHRSAGEKQAFKEFQDNRTVEQKIQGVPRQDIDTVMRE